MTTHELLEHAPDTLPELADWFTRIGPDAAVRIFPAAIAGALTGNAGEGGYGTVAVDVSQLLRVMLAVRDVLTGEKPLPQRGQDHFVAVDGSPATPEYWKPRRSPVKRVDAVRARMMEAFKNAGAREWLRMSAVLPNQDDYSSATTAMRNGRWPDVERMRADGRVYVRLKRFEVVGEIKAGGAGGGGGAGGETGGVN